MKQELKQKTPLILHGHFYQPPRENPLVEIIPQQPSATPAADWNERVYSECYRTNAYSRYLDGFGHVLDIINNYEYISFNFGPTLLSWMEKNHSRTYLKIQEADKKSLERLGHGNAIAQAYNHTILPLSHDDDIRTQIVWGIKDFTHRFNRFPEGMWLPETAVNKRVIDILIEQGIRYIILSPYQVARVEDDKGKMIDVRPFEVPYSEPFLIDGEVNGSISAFFYHPDLASQISFGHLLQDADHMYKQLTQIKQAALPPLIHTATDGEIYGHHEPFGDMALAALIKKIGEKEDFYLTNYACYLDKHTPTKKAILNSGEDGKGSSWSCIHGVSRWYKDCGCNTGALEGWNQKWRGPLREAVTFLADQVDVIFKEQVKIITHDSIKSEELLYSYSSVMSNFVDVDTFLIQLEEKGVTIDDKNNLARLLEGQRFKHYMFTSCGWFFNDIGGLEPKQNIHYGIECASLYQPFTDTDLQKEYFQILSHAKSNRRSDGSGRAIARNLLTLPLGKSEAAAYFLMNQNFATKADQKDTYGKFDLLEYHHDETKEKLYTLTLLDTKLKKTHHIEATVNTIQENGYLVSMKSKKEGEDDIQTFEYTSSAIPLKMLEEVYSWIDASMNCMSDEEMLDVARNISHYSLLVQNAKNVLNERLFIESMGTSLAALRSLFTTPITISWDKKRESISYILTFVSKTGREIEKERVKNIFTAEIEKTSRSIDLLGFNYERGSYLLDVLNIARAHSFQPSITLAQESLQEVTIGKSVEDYPSPLTSKLLSDLKIALNFSSSAHFEPIRLPHV